MATSTSKQKECRMKFSRSSGILLHPTSLPGDFGIGDLGPEAYKWIDFLAESGCKNWQILPLGPTGYGNSPYQSFSSFAGNILIISPEILFNDGLLSKEDLSNHQKFNKERVDYSLVKDWKLEILSMAYNNAFLNKPETLWNDFLDFKKRNKNWLQDFSDFITIKNFHNGKPWVEWDTSLRDREENTLKTFRIQHQAEINEQSFFQFLFFRQWENLRSYAHSKNIQIIGDIPIYVAHDSVDVWVNRELFTLKENGMPSFVAGVPPDYFSKTGQLWGNPLYHWEKLKEDNFQWWIERIRAILNLVDVIRLDHFRGFHAYWEIPGDAQTAEHGRWVEAPGFDLFTALIKVFPELPFIAEDLGVISEETVQLRNHFNLPGMKVLQFAFGDTPNNPFLPHNYERNYIAYTGTHDNDTTKHWYEQTDENTRNFYRSYLQKDGSDVSWDFIRAIWSSVAIISIAPFQDFLRLGKNARMNFPGTQEGNWEWRMSSHAINSDLAHQIQEIN